ncbi:hypothetical protein NMG60_11000769 [Bertholletia excelsa]
MAIAVLRRLPPRQPLFFPPPSASATTTTTTFFSNPKNHHQRNHKSISKPLFSSPPFRNGNTPPETECPVPVNQQPVNEYQALSTSFPFSWAAADVIEYSSRLAVTGAAFALFVGLPVSWFGSSVPNSDPLKPVLAAISSGLFVVTLAVLRMYLGWAYVGNRLLSATVEYEETGWYDGQVWVKTAEVLARDRLLGSFSVKPVLNRLKNTLIGLAASLFICVLLLINLEGGEKDSYLSSGERGGRSVPGVYRDESARSFEPDAFHSEPDLQ